MNETERSKLIEIMSAHKGRDRAISNDDLAAAMDMDKVSVRELYSDMVCSESAYFGSHPDKGFFIIVDQDDFDLSTSHIESRISKLSRRLKALRRMHESKQMLTFEEAQLRIKDAFKVLEEAPKAHIAPENIAALNAQ